MRVAIYARVSTDDQNTQTQINECVAYCKARNWEHVIFADQGISGTKTSRPEFDKMLDQAKAGEFTAVMVWRFDRASRSTMHLLTLLDDLRAHNVDFISIREQVDTSTAAGKLMFTMISAFAQFERDSISDRTKAAMKRLKSEGKQVGRAQEIDRAQVFELKQKGLKAPAIAQKLNISASHVRRILAA